MSLLQDEDKRTSKMLAIRIEGERTTVRMFEGEIDALHRICAETGIDLNDFCSAASRNPTRLKIIDLFSLKLPGLVFPAYPSDFCLSDKDLASSYKPLRMPALPML